MMNSEINEKSPLKLDVLHKILQLGFIGLANSRVVETARTSMGLTKDKQPSTYFQTSQWLG